MKPFRSEPRADAAAGRLSAWIRDNILGFIAIFVALSGTAIAVERASVGTSQLKDGAVKAKKIAPQAVTSGKLAHLIGLGFYPVPSATTLESR